MRNFIFFFGQTVKVRLPKMVYENENIIIAGVPVEGSLKWKYELTVMTEINVKDGEMIIRVWLLWDDGRRPGDEIGIYALPEDEIGAYVEYQDGTREKVTEGFTVSGFDSSAAGHKTF